LQTSKFEIYEDIKQSPPPRKTSLGSMSTTAPIQQLASIQRDVAFKTSNTMNLNTALGAGVRDGGENTQHQSPRLRGTTHTGRLAPVRTFLSSTAPRDLGPMSEVDRLRTTLDNINIKDQQSPAPSGACYDSTSYRFSSITFAISSSTSSTLLQESNYRADIYTNIDESVIE
jgi:hypothetical protein